MINSREYLQNKNIPKNPQVNYFLCVKIFRPKDGVKKDTLPETSATKSRRKNCKIDSDCGYGF